MRWIIIITILVDLLLVNLGFMGAFLLRFSGELPIVNWQAYINIMPWISVGAFIIFYWYGLYTSGRRPWEEIFSALICSTGLLFLTTLALSFFLRQFAFPRLVFILSLFLHFVFMVAWRRFVWVWYLKRVGPERLVVVGSASRALEKARRLLHERASMYQVVGLVIDKPELRFDKEPSLPILGQFGDIAVALDRAEINGVLFCEGISLEVRNPMLTEVLSRDLSVYVVPDMYEMLVAQSQLEQLDGIPVFRLTNFTRQSVRAWKRAMDFFLALAFGIPAIPLVCIAALAIKLESPSGPVFLSQERVGRGGKVFKLLKLRTMVPDAEKCTGPMLSNQNDPRVTHVGRILRNIRIDEIPQLWNVFKGEMSFVGPRPERPFFVEQFNKEIPCYDYRHQIKGGITGLAQIEGKYSSSPEDKLRFDLLYAKTVSPLKDVKILLHTIKVMLMRNKAL